MTIKAMNSNFLLKILFFECTEKHGKKKVNNFLSFYFFTLNSISQQVIFYRKDIGTIFRLSSNTK